MEALYITLGVFLGAIALTVAAWLFFTASKSGKVLGKLKDVKFAHRGLHGELGDYTGYAAENSLTAFRRATEMGYGIELDVRMSRDGVVVVYHDDNLRRVCGVDRRVIDMTTEELRAVRLKETEDYVPTFREVLDTVGGRVPLLVELKGEDADMTVARETVKMLLEYDGPYIIESFNPLLLGEVKKLAPKIPRGFLNNKHTANEKRRTMKYRLIQRCFLNFIARPHFIAMNKTDHKLFPFKLLSRLFGTAKMAWTIRTPEQEAAAVKNGFTGIIFEQYLSDIPEFQRNKEWE